MPPSAPESYLVTQVMTATPQKLQLMLIEGAIHGVQRTRRLWQEGKDEEAGESLIRAQQIISELLCGLNREVDSGLARKVASVYLFVFRTLIDAHTQRSEAKLDDALKVLETERETWRQVCSKLGSSAEPEVEFTGLAAAEPVDVAEPPASSSATPVPRIESLDEPPPAGLSLEA